MALEDYAAMDEDDFYGQDFERKGVVSVWAGLEDDSEDPENLDVLQDLCGVGCYDLDYQEGNCFEFELVPIRRLLEDISFSNTFMADVLETARKTGVEQARWVLVQYDFAYDPAKVKRPIAADPVFLGVFSYRSD